MFNTKIIFLITLALGLSYYQLSANISPEAQNFINELDSKNNDYYSGERIVSPVEAKDIIDKVEKSSTLTDEEKLFLKMEAYALWANTSIMSGTFEEDFPILKSLYQNIRKEKDFKNGRLSSQVYTSFAQFASSMIGISYFNNSSYSYVFIVDSMEYSRLALIKDPNNKRASVIAGIGQSIPVNYFANTTYSISVKLLDDTYGLPEYIVFLSHIYKSMANMRVNETEKAFNELNKAENIYPNGFFVYMLKTSYAEGGSGFISTEGNDLDSLIGE